MFYITLITFLILYAINFTYSASVKTFTIKVDYPHVNVNCQPNLSKNERLTKMTIAKDNAVFYTFNSNAIKPIVKTIPGINEIVNQGMGKFSIQYYDRKKTFGAFECKVYYGKGDKKSANKKITVKVTANCKPYQVGEWVATTKGNIPPKAFVASFDKQKRPLYACAYTVPETGITSAGTVGQGDSCVTGQMGKSFPTDKFSILMAKSQEWAPHKDMEALPAKAYKFNTGNNFWLGRCVTRGETYIGSIYQNMFWFAKDGIYMTSSPTDKRAQYYEGCKNHEVMLC